MEVDEKSMIRNRDNQIPHPFTDTIRERNILNCTVTIKLHVLLFLTMKSPEHAK